MGGRNASTYDTTNDAFYLKYLAARLGAFSNVWWSMANEWNDVQCKSRGINGTHLQSPSPVWDELFGILSAADPWMQCCDHGCNCVNQRQTSIHNGNLLYNHSRSWITHVSLQGLEDRTPAIRAQYKKPVIWVSSAFFFFFCSASSNRRAEQDEVEYEGNISAGWGQLSGLQEADRFWWGASLGVFTGHSETLLHADVQVDDDQPLWWAKGGQLIGQSPRRIAWLRSLQGLLFPSDLGSLTPTQEWFGTNASQPAIPCNPHSKPLEHCPGGTPCPPSGVCPAHAPPVVANMLSGNHESFKFLHFMRNGSWSVPLGPAQSGKAWHMHTLDYWSMSNQTTVIGGPSVTINVTTEATHVGSRGGVNIVLRLETGEA